MYLPFVDELVKTPIAPGASILVEYDPTAAWYQASLNIAAGWLQGGGVVVYAVASQPPDDVRSQLAKLGVDVKRLESDDKLRLFDWYTATLGRKSTEKYAYYSLKAADLNLLYSKNMPGSGLTPDVHGMTATTATDAISRIVMGMASSDTLRILDDLSCLARFNEEKSWVELVRTRLIPLGRLQKSTGIGGIIKGIHSDWVLNGSSFGKMCRRHIRLESVIHIGKEANELEETEVLGLDDETYVQYLPIVTGNDKAD